MATTCPNCGDYIDSRGNCPACYSDAMGSCEECGSYLEVDGTCLSCNLTLTEAEEYRSNSESNIENLLGKIVRLEGPINESFRLASRQAKQGGGTMSHKVGYLQKDWQAIVRMAKDIGVNLGG